jgi:hydroxymethylpyrimidine pyrophosphatase-like HAD family hydrolase
MRYHALASSFDETIARGGTVDPATAAGLRRLVASGRHLVLLSRRTVTELRDSLPGDLFALVVAEYGGVLWRPATDERRPLAARLPHPLVRALAERGIEPVATGEVALTVTRDDAPVLGQVVETEGLDLTVVVDKDVAIALPTGVDKATGLAAALAELDLSFHNVAGIGDAGTDASFLRRCECSVAVANAPPELAGQVDLVTKGKAGKGVVELIDQLVASDLAELEPALNRHRLLLGTTAKGEEVTVPSYDADTLLAGSSGTGKSKLAAGLLERLTEQDYQFLVLDPEGDHAGIDGAVTLGDRHTAPTADQVMDALEVIDQRVVANLLAVRLEALPAFFKGLLRRLQELRTRTGRPHLLMLDEAHHFLPLPGDPGAFPIPRWLDGLIMATVHPETIAPAALSLADMVVTFGEGAGATLRRYCGAIGEACPASDVDLEPGQALAWSRTRGSSPVRFSIAAGQTERRPHLRRWSESELNEAKSFRFTGPDDRLDLRAGTLAMFIHLAGGVDDETWTHHLGQGDYSAWLRDGIRDETVAEQVATVEQEAAKAGEPAAESRRRVIDAIRERYEGGHP